MRCLEPMKITEILRLREMELNLRDIAAAVDCSKTTVGEILNRCKDCGLTYEEATKLSSEKLNELIYPDSFVKPDLLLLDDFGMKQLDLGMTQDFLEVIEERYHRQRSVAISAQLPVKNWVSVFKDQTIADAVLDRIVRNAYRFDLKGPSRRPTIEHKPADAGDDNMAASE